jgi:hypothetical protein
LLGYGGFAGIGLAGLGFGFDLAGLGFGFDFLVAISG